MLVEMAKVHLIGHRSRLDASLDVLHRTRLLHLIDVNDDAGVKLPPLRLDDDRVRELEELRYLRARVDALLALVPHPPGADSDVAPLSDGELITLRRQLDEDGPEIERLVRRADTLQAELDVLPRYLDSLRRLMPLVSELTELEGYETTALLLEARHADVLGELNVALDDLLVANYEIISDQVDSETVGAVLVFPRARAREVRAILDREQLTRVRLPKRFEAMPFRSAVAAMERRLLELPIKIAGTSDALDDFIRPRRNWADASVALARRLDQLSAVRHLGATPHTFVISGWVPVRSLGDLRRRLAADVGETVTLERASLDADDEPPVLMENPAPVRPFEFLVKLLALPRYGGLDPTRLMSLFLPLFFGMMLGDIVYGTALLVIAFLVARRFKSRPGGIRDLARVLQLAAGWSVVWGVIYGEFLGDLGHRWFGLEPVWINREEALEPLLIFSIAVGAAHVLLGLVIGIFEARRSRQQKLLYERVAMVTALTGLFLIVGVAADRLPDRFVTPGIGAAIVGLVVLMALGGPIGVIMGPIELMGTMGNILSYLRIAAIGLASVYLARVANELGASGPVWLGVVVAALFHALNLALGTFSPTIQSLRLHYVEFFGKFYESGGEPYRPFGAYDGSGPAATA
jgi:V/A-type H+-transporting ATPase subunit I